MNLSLGAKSIVLFFISVIFLVLLTVFETFIAGLSATTERIIAVLFLVLPAVIGVNLGILSLARKESKPWLGILGILFNVLWTLFHLFLLSFAG
jgi:hypothetical protein